MMFKRPLRYWIVLVSALLFLSAPVQIQGENSGGGSGKTNSAVKKKTAKSSKSASSKKKKVSSRKKGSPSKRVAVKKNNKSTARSRVKTAPTQSSHMYQAIARPLADAEGPIQNVVEQEIQFLKTSGQLREGDEISIQVFDLDEKKLLVDINGETVRNAASLIKPYVMLAVYEQISRQELEETPEITRQISRMITVSDNQATNRLIRSLGNGDVQQGLVVVNALLHKYGFIQTSVRELIPDGGKTYSNRTSAADATAFFRMLYEQRLVNPHYSRKMNDILLKNVHDRIETYRIKHDGVAVADKTGYVRGLNADCGIVYRGAQNGQGHDYVLSIFIENKDRPPDGNWGRRKTAVIRYLSDRIYHNLKNCSLKG